ncbi:MAG: radical SAM protein [Prevotellaceae bacterium]|nr:radical SAM protein [Prevotellaceae bacterium]
MNMLQFNEIIYGPMHSRRLGNSLGVNLLPIDAKICTFNCIYCECGFNTTMKKFPMPRRAAVKSALNEKLQALCAENQMIDVITFAGNGEPTLHPQFREIIDDAIELRNKYFPETKICVLTNSTQISKKEVFDALMKADNAILKFDSAIDETMRQIDRPARRDFSVAWLLENLQHFENRLIVQTMFLRGTHNGQTVDNTTKTEISAYINAMQILKPQQVMIYGIDRQTPVKSLHKIPREELEKIAEQIRKSGIEVNVAG